MKGLAAAIVVAVALHAQEPTRGLKLPKTADGRSVELYAESHALIIGMSRYRSGWRALPGVESDIEPVRAVLQAHGFVVEIARDLTRDAFDQTMRRFIAARGLNPLNRLVIYFAGHGHTQATADGRQLGFIVPVDAPLPETDPAGFKSLAITMDRIGVYAREIETRHALMVFDSCFSGTLFDATRALPGALASNLEQPVRQFITSGTAGQEVSDTSEFRRQFVAGLQGEADKSGDGYITGTELGQFLEDRVASYTRQTQTPRFGKIRDPQLDRGEMIFVSPAGATAAPVTTPAPLARPAMPARAAAEVDREDATSTATGFLAAIDARDVDQAYQLLADSVRQAGPRSAFEAMLANLLKLPLTSGRQLTYVERSPDGKVSMSIFTSGDQMQRVTLIREGVRWGTFNFNWVMRSAAVPAQGPPFRTIAENFLGAMNANRFAEAVPRVHSAVRRALSQDQLNAAMQPYVTFGRPVARELLYAEQDAATTAFVVFRTRYANTTLLDRVSLVLENGEWRLSAWVFAPAGS